MHRDVDAWGVFAVQSLALTDAGWKPRLQVRIDAASGGGAHGTGTLREFNPLYVSSEYAAEGQFVGLGNLLMVTPGVSVTTSAGTRVSVEYGFAARLDASDAARAGGLRAYAGTENVPGREIGGLLRVAGTRSVAEHVTVFLKHEHLVAGDVLRRAGLPSGRYSQVGTTVRY
jgi:hypothetical protein